MQNYISVDLPLLSVFNYVICYVTSRYQASPKIHSLAFYYSTSLNEIGCDFPSDPTLYIWDYYLEKLLQLPSERTFKIGLN